MAKITYDGQEYDATPEALAELDKRGIKYSAAAEETSVMDIAGGAARGALHGVTFGLADMPIGSGGSVTERIGLQPYEQVQKETPVAAAVGDIASGFAIPGGALLKVAGKLGVSAKVLEKMLTKVGTGAAQAAGEGAVRAVAEGDDVGSAAGLSAVLGGGGTALGGAVSSAAKGVQGALQSGADKTLARSVGVLGKEAAGMGNPEQVASEVANIVREVSPSSVLSPKSARDRYVELDAVLNDKYGPLVDKLIGQANIPQGATRDAHMRAIQQLMGEAAGAPIDTDVGRAYASSLNRNIKGMVPTDDPLELRQLKTAYNKAAYTAPGASIPDTGKGMAAGTQAGAVDAALDHAMQQHATPAVRQAFHTNNAEFAKRAKIRDLAEHRTEVEATQTLLPELATAAAGAGIGAATSEDTMLGAITGGVGAGIAGATTSGFLKSMQTTRGLDRLSNMASGAARGAGAVSSAIEAMGDYSGAGRRVLVSALIGEDEPNAP